MESAMPAEKLLNLREHPRKSHEQQRYSVDGLARPFLRHVDQAPFQQGYIAGWQSVRGADDHPIMVPQSPVFIGEAMYMVGFSRGARDAGL
jgi:hypothetical protein